MIRKATIQNFNFFYELYMHPSINPYLLYEPMDIAAFNPIFTDLVQNDLIYIYFNKEELPVGMFKLMPHTYRSAHIVYLGGVAVHPKWTGKGNGFLMMKAIIDYAKEQGFLRIELSVAVQNLKAISLYERVGFEKEGTLKKYTYLKEKDTFIDEILMAYIL